MQNPALVLIGEAAPQAVHPAFGLAPRRASLLTRRTPVERRIEQSAAFSITGGVLFSRIVFGPAS